MSIHSKPHLKDAIRDTMDQTGWNSASELVVDTTARRLAGDEATDEALEDIRQRLWTVWRADFEIWGPC